MDQRLYIDFVRAGASKDQSDKPVSTASTSDGDNIKQFYEELVQTDFSKDSCKPTMRKNKIQSGMGVQKQNANGYSWKCDSTIRSPRETKYRTRSGSSTAGSDTFKTGDPEFDNQIDKKLKSDTMNEVATDNFDDMHSLHLDLLNFAQNGNLSDLRKLLQNSRVDVNFQDQYGWTALMCAAKARHLDIVKLLLERGANKYIHNKNRQTVLEMCADVFEEILKLEQQQRKWQQKKKEKSSFYCELCKSKFSDTNVKEHNASTVHIFNTGVKPKIDQFMIAESNIGFQLMQKSGWDGESGLGTSAQGQKYPVKTTLKRDRKGLGVEDKGKKPKVTHFGPNDKEAIKSVYKHTDRVVSARTNSRRERNRKIQKDKKWERDMRMFMNIP